MTSILVPALLEAHTTPRGLSPLLECRGINPPRQPGGRTLDPVELPPPSPTLQVIILAIWIFGPDASGSPVVRTPVDRYSAISFRQYFSLTQFSSRPSTATSSLRFLRRSPPDLDRCLPVHAPCRLVPAARFHHSSSHPRGYSETRLRFCAFDGQVVSSCGLLPAPGS